MINKMHATFAAGFDMTSSLQDKLVQPTFTNRNSIK